MALAFTMALAFVEDCFREIDMWSSEGEQQLIERSVDGDRGALEKLLLQYSPQLTAHIAARLPCSLRSTFCAEDVTQEALTRAYLKIRYLRNKSPQGFLVWLRAVGEKTLMELIKFQRRQKRGGKFQRIERVENDALLDVLEHLPADTPTASQQLARREAVAALRVSIAGLTSDQRQAIQLHVLQRMTLEETARVMGRSMPAVRGLIQRGKQNLAEAMGRASAWLSTA